MGCSPMAGGHRPGHEHPMKTIDQLTADDFVPYVGGKFRPAATGLDLTFVAIDRREFPGWGAAARQPFSLILRGSRRPVVAEGLYRMAIDDGPDLSLYLIPIFTTAPDHQDYQIVFN
jgi:Domain of unknown function (DUF6916)